MSRTINVETRPPAPFRRATFVRGATAARHFPADAGVEVAFAGRSNAGKSSAINTITGLKALARTSRTPGRTREINFFELDERRRLVDLPGYGYAKVSGQMRARWAQSIEQYLGGRRCLVGLILIMDVRRPFTELDLRLVQGCVAGGHPVHALLTKSDKLGRGPAQRSLLQARALAARSAPGVSLQLFSATRRIGVEEATRRLAQWLEL